MLLSIDQILPSIQSLGVFGYWIIAAASMLEAFFFTGIIVPGTLIVDAGGVLVQRGLLDFFDLVWFVAIGSVLGGEASYWTGRLAKSKLNSGSRFMRSRAYLRAQTLFARHGGLALVVGRFSGPVAGLVPLVAALTGMRRRSFVIWNLAGSLPYAFVHVTVGYSIGGALGWFSGLALRYAVLGALIVALLALIWWLLHRLFALLPLVWSVVEAALAAGADWPPVARWRARHPHAAAWLSRRIVKSQFWGLPLTFLTVAFVYVFAVWAYLTLNFLTAGRPVALDQNVAAFLHLFWSPALVRVATVLTALGDSRAVALFFAAAIVWLAYQRHWPLVIGLTVAVIGDVLTVLVLKFLVARPRSELGYFLETSGSFPSGHAAISVAFFSTLLYVIWRAKRLDRVTAIMLAGVVAFAIGASRLLLIEHYLTDVLNGWLIGTLWFLIGVGVAEWRLLRTGKTTPAPVPSYLKVAALCGVALLLAGSGWRIATYDKPLSPPLSVLADQRIATPDALSSEAAPQRETLTLTGEPGAPISLVVIATDEAAIRQALTAAGWVATPTPTVAHLLDLAFVEVRDQVSPETMVLPEFRAGTADDLALRSGPANDVPLIARLWRTQYVLPDGRRIFLASVAPDDLATDAIAGRFDFARALATLEVQLQATPGMSASLTPLADSALTVLDLR